MPSRITSVPIASWPRTISSRASPSLARISRQARKRHTPLRSYAKRTVCPSRNMTTKTSQAMPAISRESLMSLEAYARARPEFRSYAIADEDLERENETKTSAVHFLRFELSEEMAAALKYGVALSMGVDHPNYSAKVDAISAETRSALVRDLR